MGSQRSELVGIDSKYCRLTVRRRIASTSRPRSSVCVAGGDAAFPQFVEHGGVVDAQVVADSRQGPAEVVEVDGVVAVQETDQCGGASAHRAGGGCC